MQEREDKKGRNCRKMNTIQYNTNKILIVEHTLQDLHYIN